MSIKKIHHVENIGARFQEWRSAKGIKAIEIAKSIGISSGSLSDIENDKISPSAKTLAKISRYTDINLYWLLTGEGPMLRESSTAMPKSVIPIEDIPKENIKAWLDDFWAKADQKNRHFLECIIERNFPEYKEFLKKMEGYKDEDTRRVGNLD